MGIFDKLFKPNVEKLKARGDVEGLIKVLKHKNPEVRSEAEEALGEIGKPAVEPLIQALKDKSRFVRERAAAALGKIGDERAVEPLTQALRDEDEYVRWNAAWALGTLDWKPRDDIENAFYLIAKKEWDECATLGKSAVEPLIQALKDGDIEARQGAAYVLGDIGDERAVEPLIQALKDEDMDVRLNAEESLVAIGEPAVEPLIQALKDKDKDVREAAEEALNKIKAKKKLK